jgi:hypothetical protein
MHWNMRHPKLFVFQHTVDLCEVLLKHFQRTPTLKIMIAKYDPFVSRELLQAIEPMRTNHHITKHENNVSFLYTSINVLINKKLIMSLV